MTMALSHDEAVLLACRAEPGDKAASRHPSAKPPTIPRETTARTDKEQSRIETNATELYDADLAFIASGADSREAQARRGECEDDDRSLWQLRRSCSWLSRLSQALRIRFPVANAF